MRKWILLIVIESVLIFQSQVKAAEIYPFFRGVREEGMGGAGVATVNDETALFLNPAGLGKIRGPIINVANPELEMNYNLNTALGTTPNFSVLQDPQSLLGMNRSNPDKNLHARIQAFPSFVTTNFGFGVLANYTLDSQFRSATNIFHLDYKNDYAAVLGYCFRLFEGRLKIGISGKVVNRVSVSQDIPANSTGLSFSNLASEGTGAGWDGGILLTAPWALLPTLGVVAHDIGNTYFNLGSGYFYKTGKVPPAQYQSVDAALAIFPIHNNRTRSSFTVEYHDLQNPESADLYRRVHAGAELNFNDTLFLRAGMNQRYYTAGIEFDFGHNQFQLATYGEEIGTPTANQEDRRYTLQYNFRL